MRHGEFRKSFANVMCSKSLPSPGMYITVNQRCLIKNSSAFQHGKRDASLQMMEQINHHLVPDIKQLLQMAGLHFCGWEKKKRKAS